MEVVFNSLQTQKGLELVFRSQFLQNFLMKFFFVSQVLSFRLTKQTSKNVADPTFKSQL